jgi:hypothetical protein
MKNTKTDIDSKRINHPPDKSATLFEGRMENQGFVVMRVDLRQYLEHKDDRLGEYSLLTVLVETDRGSVEMKYDEGYRGRDALESATAFLREYVGLSALINRALIELAR